MRGTSLISGWFPWVLLVLTGSSAGTLLWCHRRAPARLRWPAITAVVAVAAAVVVFGQIDPFQYRVPPAVYLWPCVGLFVVALGIATWRAGSWRRRTLGVVAAVLAALASTSLINVHYAYYPTVGALMGEVSPYETDQAGLRALLQRAASTGKLPTSGRVFVASIPAPASGFRARRALVYVPPAWFLQQRPRLSVLVLLHGTPGRPGDWFRSGAADRATNAYAAAHGGDAPILVVPDVNGSTFADTECVDGPRGNAETYLTDDVSDYAIDVLGASADRARWGLVGLSAGGTCAMTLALRHPDRYAAFANFGGDDAPNVGSRERTIRVLFGGDHDAWAAHDPATLLEHGSYPGLRAWFEVGTADSGPRRAAERLAPAATAAGIDTTLRVRRGGHSYAFWRPAFSHSLDWLCASVGVGRDTAS